MKYNLIRLDNRFSYRKHFEFYLGFAHAMARVQGPVMFNDALVWFTKHYGWSAEIRQWTKIYQWNETTKFSTVIANKMPLTSHHHCNPNWSWSDSHRDLRIYVASEAQLVFFRMAFVFESDK